MELFRMSPDTGEILRRLNVFEGQVLHGKIFRIEQLGPSEDSVRETVKNLWLAKIALGSHLIEAVVDQPLAEGSKAILQVMKLGEDSLVLHLLNPETSVGRPVIQEPVAVPVDAIEWSEQVKSAMLDESKIPGQIPDNSIERGIVEGPELSALPRSLAGIIRSAISQGFIDPVTYETNPPAVRVALHAAIEDLNAAISRFVTRDGALPVQASVSEQTGITTAVREMADSIRTLVELIRPVLSSIPASFPEVSESTAATARDIARAVEIFRSVYPAMQEAQSASESFSGKSRTVQTVIQGRADSAVNAPATSKSAQTEIPQIKIQAPGQANVHDAPVKSPDASQVQGTSPQLVRDSAPPGIPVIQNLQQTSFPPDIQANLSAAKPPEQVTIQKPVSTLSSSLAENSEAGKSPDLAIRHGRELLTALRTLISVSNRMQQSGSLDLATSASISAKVSTLTSLTDALEGAMIAPLLTHVQDVPDAVPRILFSMLYPGGSANAGILQTEKMSDGKSGKGEQDRTEPAKEHNIGILNIRTETLGRVRIRLDYDETEKNGEIRRSAGGRFITGEEAGDEVSRNLSKLDRSLDARGIKSAGFTVTRIRIGKTGENLNDRNGSKPGGLDIKA